MPAGAAPTPEERVARVLAEAGGHVSGGRRRPRDVLYMAAIAARRFNPEMSALYDRLRERGKHHKVAVTAVMRRLVVTANVLLCDRRMWEDRTANAA